MLRWWLVFETQLFSHLETFYVFVHLEKLLWRENKFLSKSKIKQQVKLFSSIRDLDLRLMWGTEVELHEPTSKWIQPVRLSSLIGARELVFQFLVVFRRRSASSERGCTGSRCNTPLPRPSSPSISHPARSDAATEPGPAEPPEPGSWLEWAEPPAGGPGVRLGLQRRKQKKASVQMEQWLSTAGSGTRTSPTDGSKG